MRRAILIAVNRSVVLANNRRSAEGVRGERILRGLGGLVSERHEARVRTLGSIGRNIIDVTLLVVATLTILATLGIPLGPILTGAGIGGIAFGFGAQALVKDYLSGVFMLMEDQYGVGDHIDTGEVVARWRRSACGDEAARRHGQVCVCPQWEITRSQSFPGLFDRERRCSRAYNEDTGRVLEISTRSPTTSGRMRSGPTCCSTRPNVAGVNAVTGTTMTLRIFAKCAPNKHWGGSATS